MEFLETAISFQIVKKISSKSCSQNSLHIAILLNCQMKEEPARVPAVGKQQHRMVVYDNN